MAQELTKGLIQDLSCDPKDCQSTAYIQICCQAEEWYRKAESQIHPMFRDAIQGSAREILTNAPQSALHFDINMISRVGEHLESAGLAVRKEFSRFALEVTDHYQSTFHSFLNLPEVDSSIREVVSNVSDRIEVVAQDIETWGHGISELAGRTMRLPLPESVRSFLGNMVEVTRVANGVTHVAEQVGVALSSLWTKTEAAVSRADVLNEKVKDLRNSLVMPAIKGQPDKVAAVEAEIKVVEGLLAQEASGIGKALENVRAGFQAVGMIAGLLGHSELANDAVAVGEAAVSIAGSIATVVAGSSLGGPAMPVLAIAGTVAVLVSHFLGKNRGPSTEEIILKQMDLLAKHLDRRFDRIEAMIQKGVEYLAEHIDRRVLALSEHIDERFERIEKALTYMCKEMLEGFSKLHEHAENHYTAILLKLDGLATSIDYLHKDMLVGMTTLYKQEYTNIRDAALTSIARSSIQDGQHRDYYRRIRKWIKEDSKEELLSGSEEGSTLVVGVRRGLGGLSSGMYRTSHSSRSG